MIIASITNLILFNFDVKNYIFPLALKLLLQSHIRNETTKQNFMNSRSSSRTSNIGNHGKIQSAKLQLEIKVEIVAQWSLLSTSWIPCTVPSLWSKVFVHQDDKHVVLDIIRSKNPSAHLHSSKFNWSIHHSVVKYNLWFYLDNIKSDLNLNVIYDSNNKFLNLIIEWKILIFINFFDHELFKWEA